MYTLNQKAKIIAAQHFLSGVENQELALACYNSYATGFDLPEGVEAWEQFEGELHSRVLQLMEQLYENIVHVMTD